MASARTGKNTGPRSVRSTAITRPEHQDPDLGDHEHADVEPQPARARRAATPRPRARRRTSRGPAASPASSPARARRPPRTPAWTRTRPASSAGRASAGTQPLPRERAELRRDGWRRHRSSGADPAEASHCCSSVVERAGGPQPLDGIGHAPGERAALVQHGAELLGCASAGRQLPDDLAVVQLGRGDVERRGQVDDDRVHLAVRECQLGVVVGVEHGRLGRGRDLGDDRVVAGGADLRAQPGVLQPGDRVVAPANRLDVRR